jgi:uncharacterized protein YqhQ
MNLFKISNFLILTWGMEILNKEVEDDLGDSDKKEIDFAVGGQAVIEGVMMRSPNNIAIAVRKPTGKILVNKRNYQTLTQKYGWLNIPFLRGAINLFEMMVVGAKAINFSANEQIEEETEEDGKKSFATKAFEVFLFIFSFVLAIGLSFGLFKFAPLLITTHLESKSTLIANNYAIFNLTDGAIKMSIFLLYIFILSLIPSFRRVFEYHGAEHKAIYNYENKKTLNIENSKNQTRFHPRCGTSFILIVFAISIIVYSLVPRPPIFMANLGMRFLLLPIISGISYEVLKLSAKYMDNAIVKAMIFPGLLFQRLTTKEPDDKQLEVGIKSLQDTLLMEKEMIK